LVRPAELRDALAFFVERAGNTLPRHVLQKVTVARSIARKHPKLTASEVADIDRIYKHLYRKLPTRPGLTVRNRTRLAQFLDDNNVQALRNLPLQLRDEAKRSPVNLRSALTMQKAVAIELLFTTLIRSNNLRCLSYSQNFVPAGLLGRQMHLVIPAEHVKNSVDLEIPLSKRTTELLRIYMGIYQPILSRHHNTDLLFPGYFGKPKAARSFAQQIVDAILEKTGIQMHLHLFRHMGALLFLNAYPGEYETVRRFLGHKSSETTNRFYVGLESVAAFRRYEETVLKLGTPHPSTTRRAQC